MFSSHTCSAHAKKRAFLFVVCLTFSISLSRVAWGLFLPLPQPTLRQEAKTVQSKESWMGMYMGAHKMGYSSVQTKPTMFQGKPAIETVSKGLVKLAVLGATVEQDSYQKTITDLKYRPLFQIFDIKSNGSRIYVEATFDYDAQKVYCKSGSSGEAVTPKTLAIPPGANLTGDTNALTEGQKLSAGKQFTFYYLEPLTIELQKVTVEIGEREKVKDYMTGKMVEAYQVKTDLSLEKMTSWETEGGETIQAELSIGPIKLRMLKEAKERALDMATELAPENPAGGKGEYVPPADFAVATAITTDKPIQHPRQARSFKALIAGIPAQKLILSDKRQKLTELPGSNATSGWTVHAEIATGPFEVTQSAHLPVTNPELKPYLKKASFLDTEDTNIRTVATNLRGKETNLYRIALAIRNWVHKNMTPDPSIGVPRSASNIFSRRRGVCRDYATLFAAIARSAGVPTRLCSGIVYGDFQGKGGFFYHAWVECWVGEWVTLDPTLYDPSQKEDYVDATHIKFAQGDVTQMFEVVSIVGKLKITVQD